MKIIKTCKYKLVNEKWKVVLEADYIDSDGTYIIGEKHGVVNLKTGKILQEPFADYIDSDGRYEINRKYGIIDLKTGKITKEAE